MLNETFSVIVKHRVVYVVANYFLSLTNAFEMQGNSVDDDDVAFAPFQKENISFACAK